MNTLTYNIFDVDRNRKNMGAPPKADKPWREKTMIERMEDPFDGIVFEEIELTGVPSWEKSRVRMAEGMLRAFYVAVPVAIVRCWRLPIVDDERDLLLAMTIIEQHLKMLSELKKLSKDILKLMLASRFTRHHFSRDIEKTFIRQRKICRMSKKCGAYLLHLQNRLLGEEDIHNDPTDDRRYWRAKSVEPRNPRNCAYKGWHKHIPGNNKRTKVDRLFEEGPGQGKKGKRYSAERKLNLRRRLDQLAA